MSEFNVFAELARMCKSHLCPKCPMCEKVEEFADSATYDSCFCYIIHKPTEAFEIVKKWSSENPPKTRQSEFLKMYPNAKIENGIVWICPKDLGEVSEEKCEVTVYCRDCRKAYWMQEIE